MVEREAFTINVPSERFLKEADYAGIASGRETDKFEDTGLTPVKSDLVDAPYVKEFPLVLECRLLHTLEIGLHTQFIGEIMDLKADQEVLGERGLPEMEKVKPIVFAPGITRYYAIGEYLGEGYEVGKRG